MTAHRRISIRDWIHPWRKNHWNHWSSVLLFSAGGCKVETVEIRTMTSVRCSSSINWRAKESARGRGHRQVSQWCFYFFILLVKATLLFNTTLCGRIRGKDKSENARLQVWNGHFLARRQRNAFACTLTNALTVWLWVCRWWILDAELCHKTKSELPPKSSRFSRGCWEKTGMDKWRQQMVPRGVNAIKTITKDPDLFSRSVHWIHHACVLYW